MADINQWGVDIFEISNVTNKRPLTAIAYTILQVRSLEILGSELW